MLAAHDFHPLIMKLLRDKDIRSNQIGRRSTQRVSCLCIYFKMSQTTIRNCNFMLFTQMCVLCLTGCSLLRVLMDGNETFKQQCKKDVSKGYFEDIVGITNKALEMKV